MTIEERNQKRYVHEYLSEISGLVRELADKLEALSNEMELDSDEDADVNAE